MMAYARPFFVPTTAVAIRSFIQEVNRAGDDNQMHRTPEDYSLYHLGDYDEETGTITQEAITMIVRAKDVLQPKEKQA